MSRRIYDITRSISPDMQVHPGDPKVIIRRVEEIEAGAKANLSELIMGSHTGTHVDPPFHFLPEGDTSDVLSLDALIGPALVVEAEGVVGVEALANVPLPGTRRILIKARPGCKAPVLNEDAANILAGARVLLVGVEGLSVETAGGDHPVHKTLLSAGVIILEGLEMSSVPPGEYELICLPLRIKDGDGAPARAVLRELFTCL